MGNNNAKQSYISLNIEIVEIIPETGYAGTGYGEDGNNDKWQ